MTDKELRRLKRVDLLELLIAQTRENDRLKKELAEAQAQLEERGVILAQAGSIAEAALQLNNVFQAAQAAADQYIVSVRILEERKRHSWGQIEKEVKAQAEQYLQQTLEQCHKMEEETRRRCETMLEEARRESSPER